jgi:hypothetical protein
MPAPSGKTTIVSSLSSRLSELGIELPKPPTPLGAYAKSSYIGNLLFLSGTLLVVNGKLASTMPLPPAPRPSGTRERRSSAFTREDSGIVNAHEDAIHAPKESLYVEHDYADRFLSHA